MTKQTEALADMQDRVKTLRDNEEDATVLWAHIHKLRNEVRGPEGFATWKDAALDERLRRIAAEKKPATTPEAPALADEVKRLYGLCLECTDPNVALNCIGEAHAAIDRLAALAVPVDARDSEDSARYRWLREQTWDAGPLVAVCQPKKAVKLGFDCPSGERLDQAIDAARAAGKDGDK